MPDVSADLSQNIITTAYLFFSHNYIALVYLAGVVLGIGLSLWRPSRFATLVLIGFAILLFSFEYDKHLIAPLRDQTIRSFISEKPHFRLQRIIDVGISEVLPVGFYVLGWTCLFTAIIFAARHEGKRNTTKK